MKKYITSCSILLLFILVLSNESKAQDISSFYFQIYQGDSLAENNNVDSACQLYTEAFKKVDFIHSRVLTSVLRVAKDAKHKELIANCKKRLKSQTPCPTNNLFLLKTIDSLYNLDQEIRTTHYWNASQYYLKNKEDTTHNTTEKFFKSKKLYEKARMIDSSNITMALELIDQHGYMGEQELGSYNYIKFQSILLHFDTDTNSTILTPILEKALQNNQITPFGYTHILDRHLYNTGGIQLYWTWFMIDNDPKLSDVEIKEIIKRRESIGIWGSTYEVINYQDSWMLNNLSRTCY